MKYRLEDMVQAGLELTGDPLGFRLLDKEFHRTINPLGGNPFLEAALQVFQAYFHPKNQHLLHVVGTDQSR